ncbi:MAG: GDP-mannose pyrophosphatase, partial [Bacteroidota bacterium]
MTHKILADDWYTLRKYSYEFLNSQGIWEQHNREAYDRGNGATILLYNQEKNTVVLTRQFR